MVIENYKQAVADKIKARLYELGMNRSEFADLMKAPQSTVTKWLSGKHNFTVKTLFEIECNLNFNIFEYQNMNIDALKAYISNGYTLLNIEINNRYQSLAGFARYNDTVLINKTNIELDKLEDLKGYIDELYKNFPELKININANRQPE